MKAIDASLINQSAKSTSANPEEACPTCGCAAWCFENGVVFCIDHGYFEPEPSDQRLYGMQVRFNQSKGLVFPLAGLEPEVPHHVGDDSFASRHRPVPQVCSPSPQEPCPCCGGTSWEHKGGTVTCKDCSYDATRPALRITPVLHTTRIDVSEQGCTAAAATAITVSLERVDGDIQGAYENGSRRLT